MSDLGETFKAMREESQTRRAENKIRGLRELDEAGIPYQVFSWDHVLVYGFDYWPSTGLFIDRKTKRRGRGIRKLLLKIEDLEKASD